MYVSDRAVRFFFIGLIDLKYFGRLHSLCLSFAWSLVRGSHDIFIVISF